MTEAGPFGFSQAMPSDVLKRLAEIDIAKVIAEDMVRSTAEKHGWTPAQVDQELEWLYKAKTTMVRETRGRPFVPRLGWQPRLGSVRMWRATTRLYRALTWTEAAMCRMYSILSDCSILYGSDSRYWPNGDLYGQPRPAQGGPVGILDNLWQAP